MFHFHKLFVKLSGFFYCHCVHLINNKFHAYFGVGFCTLGLNDLKQTFSLYKPLILENSLSLSRSLSLSLSLSLTLSVCQAYGS
jgi:hypothetical protein